MKVWSRVLTGAAVASVLGAAAAYAAVTPTTPSAPRNLKATAGDNQVTLTWSPPSAGNPISYYVVTTSPPDAPKTSTPGTTQVVTGLTNRTTYLFSVRAYNSSGLYGPAAKATATPHATPPGPPTSLTATPGPGTGQYTLAWAPPASSGSSGVVRYSVTVSSGGNCQSISLTSCIASNIAANVTSTFTVRATNAEDATGPPATVYAPLPAGATIGLDPTAGGPTTSITASGQLFLNNESITLYWDGPSHVAASVVTDGNGAFTKVVKPFSGDRPKIHRLCASVPPKPCASFSLQGPPTPTPPQSSAPPTATSPSPSPPIDTPQASGVRPGGGVSGLDIITRPPFVFLPIIGILGLLGVIAYLAFSGRRRPAAPPSAATVVHHATRPDYMAPFPDPGGAAAAPPVTPIAPVEAPVPSPQPVQPPAPADAPQFTEPPPAIPPIPPAAPPTIEPPTPTIWPAAPDEPPDLPEPSD